MSHGQEAQLFYCTALKTAYPRRCRVEESSVGRWAWTDLICENRVTVADESRKGERQA